MTAPVSRNDYSCPERPTLAEMAAMRGVNPISSVDELAEPHTFESDEEVEEFLADLYASRRANIG